MNNSNREIEKKYYVLKDSWQDIEDYVLKNDGTVDIAMSVSTDWFWKAPNVDVFRVRENTYELTVKVNDKGGTLDRLENNIVVNDIELTVETFNIVFGQAKALEKTFSVYLYKNTVLSLYSITGSPELFFEVEADDLETVKEISSEFEKRFSLRREYRSLYDVFFGEKGNK